VKQSSILATIAVLSAATIAVAELPFADNFNRQNGAAGNGWSTWGNGAELLDNELRTYGQNNVAGGVFRSYRVTPGEPIQFSFDIRTDLPAGGGWELELNSTTSTFTGVGNWDNGSRLALFRQYTGVDQVYYVVGSELVSSPTPAFPRLFASAYSHISGEILPDLSAVITIDHNDGGPIDTLTFASPGIDPLAVPQGDYLVLGNSSAYHGPHYFDNFVLTPEPTTAVLFIVAVTGILLKRRR
jgi:hypothetical protein